MLFILTLQSCKMVTVLWGLGFVVCLFLCFGVFGCGGAQEVVFEHEEELLYVQ